MKRTVKVAGSGHERMLAGGAAMTDRPPWEWRPRPIQAEPMPDRGRGITRTPAGWEAIITTAEVIGTPSQ